MSKYLDAVGGQVASSKEIEENFQSEIKKAEEYAKVKTQELRDRIMHFKESDFEQIKKEVIEKFNKNYDESQHIFVSKKEFFECLKDGENSISVASPYKQFPHNTEEEKEALFEQYREDVKNEELKDNIRRARAYDIMSDLMTEEQIEQLCSLYQTHILKSALVDIKEASLASKARIGSKERKVVKNWTDISNEAYREARLEEATEIEKIQASTEKQDEKRENIRDCINATLATVGMGGVLGAFGGEVVSLLSNTPSEGPIAIGAGALAAAALAASGVATYHELTNTPKAIEKAKELGVYDLLLERARADRKLDAFHDKIDEEYGIEEKLKEEIERGELEVPGHGL